MAVQVPIQTYRITGLDCADCANRIEKAVQKMEGFEAASVNFATGSIRIPLSDATTVSQVEETIRRIEPDARLVASGDREPGSGTGDGGGLFAAIRSKGTRVSRFGVAFILTVVGALFQDALASTPMRWAEYAVFLAAYLLAGWPVLYGAVRNILRGRVFDELFLMTVATIGAVAIGELTEAVAVMLFYAVGDFFQELAVDNSRRSIASLMDLRPDSARVVEGDELRERSPDEVAVGTVIEVRPGERIPLDGDIVDGASSVDTAALTGESVPRSVSAGDSVLSGYLNEWGTIRVETTKAASESAVSRILELVENAASRKAPTERFISRFAAVYTPAIVIAAGAIAFLPPLLVSGAALSTWVYRALVLLVISCPCALVISVPLGYFGGIGGAARNRVLFKGANYIDVLHDLSTVVVDKTGTITKGVFQVTDTRGETGFSDHDLLRWAAAAEAHSSHPIARSIRDAFQRAGGGNERLPEPAEVQEEKGYGVSAVVEGVRVLAGSARLLQRENVPYTEAEAQGTVVYVAVDGTFAGYIVISDVIRDEARDFVTRLKDRGIGRMVMLTGDNHRVASDVANRTGIDEFRPELLPQDKVSAVEAIKKSLPPGRRLAFVGDGINDAPVLMRADIGFAMGGLGSDAAIEAADVVIMDDRIDRVADAVDIALYTRKIVKQNIIFALAVKGAVLALGAFGVATMWEAVIADVGVALLAVLNATRTLRYTPR